MVCDRDFTALCWTLGQVESGSKVQMAASPRALDKAKRLLGVLWSPWGLAGAHGPTQPGMQAQEEMVVLGQF